MNTSRWSRSYSTASRAVFKSFCVSSNADDYSNDNGGLKYICDDGTVFHYYPNHRHEISLEPIDGDLYKGVYYPV